MRAAQFTACIVQSHGSHATRRRAWPIAQQSGKISVLRSLWALGRPSSLVRGIEPCVHRGREVLAAQRHLPPCFVQVRVVPVVMGKRETDISAANTTASVQVRARARPGHVACAATRRRRRLRAACPLAQSAMARCCQPLTCLNQVHTLQLPSSPPQVMGIGADTGSGVPSALLFFDRQRFLFNAGEGFQRFCVEHRIKLAKVSAVLATRTTTEATGGLPGAWRPSCGSVLRGAWCVVCCGCSCTCCCRRLDNKSCRPCC